MKEKLVELQLKADLEDEVSENTTQHREYTADLMIAHGVTVQEWIPASDPPKNYRPVLVTCGKGYRPFVARYDLVWKRWKVSHTLKITHWQPLPSTRDLPQPPKGD